MILETIVVGALQVNCYVLGCEQTRQAVVIDPGDDVVAIQRALNTHELSVTCIVATHAHFDHVLAARALQEMSAAPFYLHAEEQLLLGYVRSMTQAWMGFDPGEPPYVDGTLIAGQVVRFGAESLEVRHTPGHSPGGVTLVHPAERLAFTGDALFAGSIGRTDLPGGNLKTLLAAIRREILTLPDDYAVLSGHGPASTVGAERHDNPFLADGG